MRSRLYTGWVAHERVRPARNAFRYPVYYLALDLDELDQIGAGVLQRWAGHPSSEKADGGAKPTQGDSWAGALILAPPSAQGTPWLRRFGDYSDAFASGWMRRPNCTIPAGWLR